MDPADGLVDDLPHNAVTGAPEGRPVEFKLSVTDAAGHRWRSRDGDGRGQALLEYEFASEEAAPTAFVASADVVEYRLEARCRDESTAARLIRRWSAVGVERREPRGEGFAGACSRLQPHAVRAFWCFRARRG